MEIERKFSIHQIPGAYTDYPCKQMEQGYLCNDPIIRVRKSNEDYILTYKSKMGIDNSKQAAIIQNEVELPLTEHAYRTLQEKTEGNMVYKNRYLIPLEGGLTAEVDVFEGCLKGLVFAEVEFPDEKAAINFKLPSWFDKDISQDHRFSNYYLSKISSIEELSL